MSEQRKTGKETIIEFIKFNLFSGIATIVSFVVLNLGNRVLFKALTDEPFKFWIFDYTIEDGGLGGFLAFLAASFVHNQSILSCKEKW